MRACLAWHTTPTFKPHTPQLNPQPQYPHTNPTASLVVGNVLPLAQIPEGTVVSNVEARPGDRGIFGRTSGAYAVIVAQVRLVC